ncbi:MAG: hypothetical protein LBI17_04005 [Rickettsiales bacterium]|jgi:hypothetical protein|nr:hypothetical protein [Rickettsiales bacterium]
MSNSIDQAFVKQFEAEVHLAFQQMGTKLRSTVRTKSNVRGSSTTFQKIGRGTADTKERHGLVPVMNLDHTPVECVLQDFYAGDWVDELDEVKTNVDERRVVASAGAYALGRKSDELIIAELAEASETIAAGSSGITKAKVLAALEILNSNDVPDDGQRFAVVGVHQWNELLSMDEFSNADYVGDSYPMLQGAEARRWLGINWIMHNALPLDDETSVRTCFVYHKNAVGHASGQDVKTDITWHGERAAHFISNCMSQGASIVDGDGVLKLLCKDNSAIA